MAESNNRENQKENSYIEYNSNPDLSLLNTPVTFLNVSIMILIASIVMKICFALWTSSMASSDLFTVHGKIVGIYIGGDGRETYIDLESAGNVNRYKSSLGRAWPGMTSLKKGDLIDITAWEQGQAGEYNDSYPHYYIWQLTRGNEVIVRGDDVNKVKRESDNSINRFANLSLLFGTILAAAAYVRHLRIRSVTAAERHRN